MMQLYQDLTNCPNNTTIQWTTNHTDRSHYRADCTTSGPSCSKPNCRSNKSMLLHYSRAIPSHAPDVAMPPFGSLRKTKSPNDLHQQLMQQKPIMVVSNASVQKSGHSGFAWTIVHEATQLWWGQGLAPGPEEDMHSRRAEAFGILAALTFIQYYLSCYTPVPEAMTLTCFCDNLGVITNINTFRDDEISHPNDATSDDRDLIIAISNIVDRCQPLELQFMYVKGHQDTKADHPLTLPELHNVACNKLAKAYVKTTSYLSTSLATPEFKAAQPHLNVAGKMICRKFLAALCQQAAHPEYNQYLHQKFHWTKDDAKQIHWEVLNYAIRSTPQRPMTNCFVYQWKTPISSIQSPSTPWIKDVPFLSR